MSCNKKIPQYEDCVSVLRDLMEELFSYDVDSPVKEESMSLLSRKYLNPSHRETNTSCTSTQNLRYLLKLKTNPTKVPYEYRIQR